MKTQDINSEVEKLSELNSNQKSAILNLIDLKTSNNLDKVLVKMDSIDDKLDVEIDDNYKELKS
jgi:hypothetical protein